MGGESRWLLSLGNGLSDMFVRERHASTWLDLLIGRFIYYGAHENLGGWHVLFGCRKWQSVDLLHRRRVALSTVVPILCSIVFPGSFTHNGQVGSNGFCVGVLSLFSDNKIYTIGVVKDFLIRIPFDNSHDLIRNVFHDNIMPSAPRYNIT
ncbi:hypothetical protein L484_001162 [Morus notabilis]|uniref:Uncharacterized protein n=1 Tax=Morus notabilis TaxID=981085 RepID=W9S325_9ROSA|nr:hypothetical protein L484_001162 [Morus notabilis]